MFKTQEWSGQHYIRYLPIANHRQFSSVNSVSDFSGWSVDGHSYGVNLNAVMVIFILHNEFNYDLCD